MFFGKSKRERKVKRLRAFAPEKVRELEIKRLREEIMAKEMEAKQKRELEELRKKKFLMSPLGKSLKTLKRASKSFRGSKNRGSVLKKSLSKSKEFKNRGSVPKSIFGGVPPKNPFGASNELIGNPFPEQKEKGKKKDPYSIF